MFQGQGNITSQAEFNFYADPESAHVVLNNNTKPLWLLPWEACLKSRVTHVRTILFIITVSYQRITLLSTIITIIKQNYNNIIILIILVMIIYSNCINAEQ